MAIEYRKFLGTVLDMKRHQAVQRIKQLEAADFATATHEEIVEAEMETLHVAKLIFEFDDLSMLDGPRSTQIQIPDGWGEMVDVEANEYTVVIPFTGDARLIDHKPMGTNGGRSMSAPLEDASVRDSTVHLVIRTQGSNPETVERTIKGRIASAKQWLEMQTEMANGFVVAWTQLSRDVLTLEVGKRQAALETTSSVMKSLNIPLYNARLSVPVVKKPRPLTQAVKKSSPSQAAAEYALTDAIYDDIVQTITALGLAAERLPTTSQKLSEEDLRNVILFVLNANYEGQAVGEAFSGAGKSDILLMWKGRAAFIGECKIWHGPQKFLEAVDQLFGYTTWRDARVALIVFADPSSMTDVRTKARAALAEHPSFVRDDGDGRYTMTHPQDAAKRVTVSLLVVAATLKES